MDQKQSDVPSDIRPEDADPGLQEGTPAPTEHSFFVPEADSEPQSPTFSAGSSTGSFAQDNDQEPITWQASEFIAHQKSPSWYTALAATAAVIATLVYLITRDKTSTAVVIVAALAFGLYANRKPRMLQYTLDKQGLTIGERAFSYNEFRSFAVMDEGAFASISFLPLKRFGQLTTIYYDPKDEDKIVDLLSIHLPIENRQHDLVDRFLKRIHF